MVDDEPDTAVDLKQAGVELSTSAAVKNEVRRVESSRLASRRHALHEDHYLANAALEAKSRTPASADERDRVGDFEGVAEDIGSRREIESALRSESRSKRLLDGKGVISYSIACRPEVLDVHDPRGQRGLARRVRGVG